MARSDKTASRPFIGTSGWNYRKWRETFYQGVPQRRWLAHCARHFTGIEVNATFYRQLKSTTIAGWRDQTPPDFAFAVKGHRYVTHVRRLKDADEPVSRAKENLAPLGDKLAVVLWQLPPSLGKDVDLLTAFCERLARWPAVRHVIEFRHESWFDDETRAVLDSRGIGTCISDAPRWPLWGAVTGGIAYVRLHGHERIYASAYGEKGLGPWAEKVLDWLAEDRAVHVYFDNDAEGAAPYDALLLMSMVGLRADRDPSS